MKKKDNREPVLAMSHRVSCSKKLWVSLTWTNDYDHFYLPRNKEIPSCIPTIICLQRIVVKIASHWSRILYKWLCAMYWSLLFDPQLLHQRYRELAALSPEAIFDDIELLTVEHTKLINPVMKRMDNQLSELTMSHRVSFSLNDKPPSFWWTKGQWATITRRTQSCVYIVTCWE